MTPNRQREKTRRSSPLSRNHSRASTAAHRRKPDPTPPKGHSSPPEVPSMYNETYLRILPRDPFLLFAFWEICDARADRNSQHLLRLYDVTPAHEHQYSDIPIEKTPHGGSSYIPVPEPGRRYRLAYGYRTRAGRFVPLCTSNEIATPAGRVSARAYGPGGRRADSFRADTGFLFAFSGRTMGIASPLMNDPEIPGCIVTGSSNSLRLCHETNASLT